jgi:hypothetical protein
MAEPRHGKALIFIPDISGFTRFVNETEISHSSHVIRELLEVIMKENTSGLQVSEVEGDAVLFYRFGPPPSLEEVMLQAKTMWLAFHQHLRRYERDRICQCGACSSAENLTLKFIVHYGDIQESQIGSTNKLLGSPVITAHKLLKNNIEDRSYILFSEAYHTAADCTVTPLIDWIDQNEGSCEYEDVGILNFKFIRLTALQNEIPEPAPPLQPERTSNPIVQKVFVKAPPSLVQKVVTDIDLKEVITENLVQVKYDKEKIPRVGSYHQCILPDKELDFYAVFHSNNSEVYTYAEQVTNIKLLPYMNFIYTMEPQDDGTLVTIEIHYKLKGIFKLLNPFIRMGLKKSAFKGVKSYKDYIEEVQQKLTQPATA